MIFHYVAVNPTTLFRFSYFGFIFLSCRFTFSIFLRKPNYQKPNARRNAMWWFWNTLSFLSFSLSLFFLFSSFTVGLKKNHSSTILRNYLENCTIFKTDHRAYLFHSLSFFSPLRSCILLVSIELPDTVRIEEVKKTVLFRFPLFCFFIFFEWC